MKEVASDILRLAFSSPRRPNSDVPNDEILNELLKNEKLSPTCPKSLELCKTKISSDDVIETTSRLETNRSRSRSQSPLPPKRSPGEPLSSPLRTSSGFNLTPPTESSPRDGVQRTVTRSTIRTSAGLSLNTAKAASLSQANKSPRSISSSRSSPSSSRSPPPTLCRKDGLPDLGVSSMRMNAGDDLMDETLADLIDLKYSRLSNSKIKLRQENSKSSYHESPRNEMNRTTPCESPRPRETRSDRIDRADRHIRRCSKPLPSDYTNPHPGDEISYIIRIDNDN